MFETLLQVLMRLLGEILARLIKDGAIEKEHLIPIAMVLGVLLIGLCLLR
jgi:hypothetical protein